MAGDAKQYLISFLATLKGDKAVVRGLRGMEGQINKVRKTIPGATKGVKSFGMALTDIGKRALVTIPAWLILRSAFMGIIRTIGDVVRSNVEFEEQMARIRTVMHGTATEIDADMATTKSAIIDMAVKSRLGIEKLAEGFYFLRTSNLDTKQALEAFTPAVNLAVGTGNELAQTTRALAGVYNTMGKAITETMTDQEAFTKIADVLAFTYATQDVQLGELIASYEKFAPFVSGLDDSFTDVVTTLGFLNTRLLRSGRAGRLTGRAIIQLSKNADKLASIFGITFDPDKPVNFVNVIKQIHGALKQGTKLTEKQSKAIQDTFATRGAVPIRLLLESFDEWNEALELAGTNAEGFAQRMNDIRMNTVGAQADRLKTILAVLGNELASGAFGTGSFAETLKLLNDVLIGAQGGFKAVGNAIGFTFANLSQLALVAETFVRSGFNLGDILNPFKATENIKKLSSALEEVKKQQLSLVSWDDYVNQQTEATDQAEKEKQEREKIEEITTETSEREKVRSGELKKQRASLTHQVKLLKLAGVHEKEIAQFKLDQLDSLAQFMTLEDEELERLKAQNELLEAQTKFRQQMVTSLQTTALSLLKVMGASESQILAIKLQQLYADRAMIGETKFLLEFTKLRQQSQVALLQEKEKELQVATNLYLQYKKADEFERTRLKRLMELRQLSPEELAKRYKEDMFDQRVIDEYFSHFAQQGQQAVGEVIREMFDLDAMTVPGLTTPPAEQMRELLNPELSNPFWDSWDKRARNSIDTFSKEWTRVLSREGGLGVLGVGAKEKLAIEQTVDLKTIIENLSINLPTNALEEVAEEAGRQVTESLLGNEEFQKKFTDKIRKLI